MTEQQIDFTVGTAGERLDKLVVEQVGESLSRAQIQVMIKEGRVTVNGAQVKSGIKLKGGEHITVTIPRQYHFAPATMSLPNMPPRAG